MSRVVVPLADGFEEVEAVTVIDLLRRAGIEVVVAALRAGPVTGAHGIGVTADALLADVLADPFDMVVLPGGQPGADNLEADSRVAELLRQMAASGRFTAAICAAPKVLAAAGVLDGKRATAYPGAMERVGGVRMEDERVVTDGKVITSRGPGTAMDFALALVESLEGRKKREDVEKALVR